MAKRKPRILFVDDVLCRSGLAEYLLEPLEAEVDQAQSGGEALTLLAGQAYDLAVTDMSMAKAAGLDLVRAMRRARGDMPVICLTEPDDPWSAEAARQWQGVDLVPKPLDRSLFLLAVGRALGRQAAAPRGGAAAGSRTGAAEGGELVGNSPEMARVHALIDRVASSAVNVCIFGESGTGKELVARAIHARSERRAQPFVVLDCAAVPEGLMERELFGHVRGAFTGAVCDSPGVFELAHRGTLFLDEVGELPPVLQAMLLRVLQTREFRRVGGTRTTTVDVRVIAATNRDLAQAVREKRFREDLYYRLDVVAIRLPTLRERKEDIPLLVQHFIRKRTAGNPRPVKGLTRQAIGFLLNYDWPGNVRELENCIERAAILAEEEYISLKDLSPCVWNGREAAASPGRGPSLREVERNHILQVLSSVAGCRTKAAGILGISLRGLQYKLKDYGVPGGAVGAPRMAAAGR